MEITGKYGTAIIFSENVEESAIEQIKTLMDQLISENSKVRIMPDVHAGSGCTIGTTMTITDKIIPNLVGVDIGCGMEVVELGNIEIDFIKLDKRIKDNVPSGRSTHNEAKVSFDKLKELLCLSELKYNERFEKSIGTLGGGNHFIEIDKDEFGNKYLVIHSGSRNLGKQVADYYQKVAIKSKSGSDETPNNLCYVYGIDMNNYLIDMDICQNYADINRKTMANIILDKMSWIAEKQWSCIHNYIDINNMLIRKGAISAQKGEKVIIPINMRDGCIIGIGKGNENWNCSSPHGAGRIMSRTVAKKSIMLDDFKDTMNGIYTTSISESTLDESPFAYKPISEIVENIKDTVEISNIIKPIYNYKASE